MSATRRSALKALIGKITDYHPSYMLSSLIRKQKKLVKLSSGGIIIIIGVLIARWPSEHSIFIIRVAADAAGYLVHAIGSVPYLDYILEEEEI